MLRCDPFRDPLLSVFQSGISNPRIKKDFETSCDKVMKPLAIQIPGNKQQSVEIGDCPKFLPE